jgi:hypothetical protein
MARQKQYATPAARQAAYRQRMKDTTLWVNRIPFQRMEEATQTLYQVVHRAATREHPLATDLDRASPLDTLEALVEWMTDTLSRETHSTTRQQKGKRPKDTNRD